MLITISSLFWEGLLIIRKAIAHLQIQFNSINPLNPHDALKHHFNPFTAGGAERRPPGRPRMRHR